MLILSEDYHYIDEFGYEKCGIYGECSIGEYFQCAYCENGDGDED